MFQEIAQNTPRLISRYSLVSKDELQINIPVSRSLKQIAGNAFPKQHHVSSLEATTWRIISTASLRSVCSGGCLTETFLTMQTLHCTYLGRKDIPKRLRKVAWWSGTKYRPRG